MEISVLVDGHICIASTGENAYCKLAVPNQWTGLE